MQIQGILFIFVLIIYDFISNLNNDGYIPSDLSTNEEIINMINKANSSISSENSHKNEEDVNLNNLTLIQIILE